MENKNKKIKILTIFAVLFILLFLIISFFAIDKIGKTKGSVIREKLDVNKNFDDEYFYRKVIDEYNQEYHDNISYNETITDENLSKIKTLVLDNSSYDYPRSLTGIDKLTGLKKIIISNLDFYTVDLSKNINLEIIDITSSKVREVFIPKTKTLTTINLNGNNLGELDLSDLTNLKDLSANENFLSSINITNTNNLKNIDLSINRLTEFNINQLKDLSTLNLDNNYISKIDFNNNVNLVSLKLKSNKLSSVNLKNLNKLNELFLDDNRLTNIYFPTKFEKELVSNAISNQAGKLKNMEIGENSSLTVSDDLKFLGNRLYIKEAMQVKDLREKIKTTNLDVIVSNNYNNDMSLYDEVGENCRVSFKVNNTIIKSYDVIVFNDPIFEDYNLYKIVIDSYNNNASERLQYGDKLNTVQLMTITTLDNENYYSYEFDDSIFDTKGLEKLVGLQYVNLVNIKASKIDTKNLILLNSLKIVGGKYLENLDLTTNVNLERIYLWGNNLSKLNLNTNVRLKELELGYDDIEKLDLSNNLVLSSIKLQAISLNSLKIGNSSVISSIVLSNTFIKPFNTYLRKGTSIDYAENFVIKPLNAEDGSQIYATEYLTEDKEVANYYNKKINALSLGKTRAYVNISNINTDDYNYYGYTMPGVITVFDMTSEKYKIGDDYIYIGKEKADNHILENIKFTGVTGNVKDNKLQIIDNGKIVKEYKIARIYSNKYDLNKGYIYVAANLLDLNDIERVNCMLKTSKDYLMVNVGNNEVDKIPIVRIASLLYDLNKDYIYIGPNKINMESLVCTNCKSYLEKDKVIIKKDDEVIDTKIIASISSDKYNLKMPYIYTKGNALDLNSIKTSNCTLEHKGNTLYVKRGNEVLKKYPLLSRKKGDVDNNGRVTSKDVTLVLRHIVKYDELKEDDLLVADIDGNGKITSKDVTLMLRYITGKIEEL